MTLYFFFLFFRFMVTIVTFCAIKYNVLSHKQRAIGGPNCMPNRPHNMRTVKPIYIIKISEPAKCRKIKSKRKNKKRKNNVIDHRSCKNMLAVIRQYYQVVRPIITAVGRSRGGAATVQQQPWNRFNGIWSSRMAIMYAAYWKLTFFFLLLLLRLLFLFFFFSLLLLILLVWFAVLRLASILKMGMGDRFDFVGWQFTWTHCLIRLFFHGFLVRLFWGWLGLRSTFVPWRHSTTTGSNHSPDQWTMADFILPNFGYVRSLS